MVIFTVLPVAGRENTGVGLVGTRVLYLAQLS